MRPKDEANLIVLPTTPDFNLWAKNPKGKTSPGMLREGTGLPGMFREGARGLCPHVYVVVNE